jgi:hypothetical protein
MNRISITMHNKPSQKTLETAFPGKGKELRDLITGKIEPESYKTVARLCSECYSYPDYSYKLMTAINEVLEGHGIECIYPRDSKHPSYDYINMGDSYTPTILLRNDGKLIVSCVGDIVEKHMDWYE